MNYAYLMNATGDTKTAFAWFSYAVKTLGYNNIAGVKADPDLAVMRGAYRKEFDDLIAVKTSWHLNWGLFADEITLTNNSAFPISNVVLTVQITSREKSWTPVLKCDSISPGQTYRWKAAVTVPGNYTKDAKATATLFCDQTAE